MARVFKAHRNMMKTAIRVKKKHYKHKNNVSLAWKATKQQTLKAH
jgi:hypothetical protein